MSWLLQENYHFFVALNHYAGHIPALDGIMVFCANDLIFLVPLLLLLLWGRPCLLRKRPLRPGEEEIISTCRTTCMWSILACVLAVMINLGIEHLIFEPRPFVTYTVHLLIAHPADDSFPSDHAAISFAVACMFLYTLPALGVHVWQQRAALGRLHGWYALPLPLVLMGLAVLLACSIGIARVFVGVHYPGDILGGAGSGLAAATVLAVLRRPLRIPTDALLRVARRVRLA